MKRLFVVNLLLGIPGIIYYWMLYFYVFRGPLASLGTKLLEFIENLGFMPSAMTMGPPLAGGAIVWILVNAYLVSRRQNSGNCQKRTGKAAHWVLAFLATLVPSLLVIVVSLAIR